MVNVQFLTCPFYDLFYHRCKHAGKIYPYAVICCYLITGHNDICLQKQTVGTRLQTRLINSCPPDHHNVIGRIKCS